MRSSRFLFNTSLVAEYDGMMDWGLTVAPHGKWVAQEFGLEKADTGDVEIRIGVGDD